MMGLIRVAAGADLTPKQVYAVLPFADFSADASPSVAEDYALLADILDHGGDPLPALSVPDFDAMGEKDPEVRCLVKKRKPRSMKVVSLAR
jgi:hypothetical protein